MRVWIQRGNLRSQGFNLRNPSGNEAENGERIQHRFTLSGEQSENGNFPLNRGRRGETSAVLLLNEEPVSEFTAVKCAVYYHPTRSDEKLSEVFTVS